MDFTLKISMDYFAATLWLLLVSGLIHISIFGVTLLRHHKASVRAESTREQFNPQFAHFLWNHQLLASPGPRSKFSLYRKEENNVWKIVQSPKHRIGRNARLTASGFRNQEWKGHTSLVYAKRFRGAVSMSCSYFILFRISKKKTKKRFNINAC